MAVQDRENDATQAGELVARLTGLSSAMAMKREICHYERKEKIPQELRLNLMRGLWDRWRADTSAW